MSDARQAIEKHRRAWVAAVNARDIDAYLDVLAPDVVWLPPGQSAVEGHDSFRDWVKPFFESYEYRFSIHDPVVTVAGLFAVERGRFETKMTSTKSGDTMSHAGTYVVLWRHEPDDCWVIERYIDGAMIPGFPAS